MTDELPGELRALFDAERAAPVTRATTQTSVRAKLAAAIGTTPLGHAAAASILTKLFVVIAVAVATGSAAVALSRRDEPRPVATIAQTATSSPSRPRAGNAPAVIAPASSLASSAPTIAATGVSVTTRVARARPTPTAKRPDAAAPAPSEVALLREAMIALTAGDPSRALSLIDDDARQHPGGELGEERDTLRIRGLAALHRIPDARAAAARLFADHPDTVHRAQIERALEAKETP